MKTMKKTKNNPSPEAERAARYQAETARYEAETARYEAVVDAATAEAWGSLWASPCDSVYLYYVASLPGAPGRMLALREGTPIPEGAELATSERLSPAFTREQLRRRVWELGRRLPILANLPT